MGIIFDLLHCSCNDGPGLRTIVFLKGCPLNCMWCHNPESKRMTKQLYYNEQFCVGCRRCENACPQKNHSFENNVHTINRSKCNNCGLCAVACLSDALTMKGYEISADDIVNIVKKDIDYYIATGGGVTISGGEPLLQWEFTLEILKKCKSLGIHTAIETCGYAKRDIIEEISKYTDLFLFDYKASDEQKHIKLTGVSNKPIIENLYYLLELGKDVILRCPLVPGINDDDFHLSEIARISNRHKNILQVDVLPYHNFGVHKEKSLGETAVLDYIDTADENMKNQWRERLLKCKCSNLWFQ